MEAADKDMNISLNTSDVFLNETLPGRGAVDSRLIYVVFLSLRLLLCCISLAFSGCVLIALLRVKQRDLKPRQLLINAVITDILFGLVVGLAGVLNLPPLEKTPDLLCVRYIINIASPAFQYAQVFGCLLMTLDRVYAVAAPFRYHSQSNYSALSFVIIFFLWVSVLGLNAPVFWVKGVKRWEGPCSQLPTGHHTWTAVIRFPLVVCVSLLNCFIYACLFVFYRCSGPTCRKLTDQKTNTLSIFSKQNLSLTVTFLSSQLSILVLYLPGPLFTILVQSSYVRADPPVGFALTSAFILLYQLTPTLNSVIYSMRVRSVRVQLLDMCCKRCLSHYSP